MSYPVDPLLQALANPAARRHLKRLDQKRKARERETKPTFDPRDTDRWIDKHGRFTIPHTKGTRK